MIEQLEKKLLIDMINPINEMIKLYKCNLTQTHNEKMIEISSKYFFNLFQILKLK